MRVTLQRAPLSWLLKKSLQNSKRPCAMKRWTIWGVCVNVYLGVN